MPWLPFIVVALIAGLLQTGPLTPWPWAPDLPLALLAWVLVDGRDEGLVERAAVLGLIGDVLDPGASGFHLVVCTALGVLAIPARGWLFRRRVSSWALGAMAVSLLAALADGLWGGWGDRPALVIALRVLTTTGACVAFAWLMGGLPGVIRTRLVAE